MYAVMYEASQEALDRWGSSSCTALRNCVPLLRCGELLGLYQEFESLDILKDLNKDVALWLDYDLIPVDIAVGKVERS